MVNCSLGDKLKAEYHTLYDIMSIHYGDDVQHL